MNSIKYPWRGNSKVTITQIILNILNAYESASYTLATWWWARKLASRFAISQSRWIFLLGHYLWGELKFDWFCLVMSQLLAVRWSHRSFCLCSVWYHALRQKFSDNMYCFNDISSSWSIICLFVLLNFLINIDHQELLNHF